MPKKELPPHVKNYFRRRNLDPNQLSQPLNDALAEASVSDIKLLDELGPILEADPGPNKDNYVFVVH